MCHPKNLPGAAPVDDVSDRETVLELLQRPVQVVAGKGGVGRTVVATALALRSARDGDRTLLLEVNAPDNAARYIGARPARDEPREVLNNLWLCRMTPAGALREYALMILRFRSLYHFVFENPLVRYFLRSIPSLAEFTMMGKAWFHAMEKLPSGEPRYKRVIIDAPATGHALTLLSVSRVVADTVPKGVMKDAAEKMAAFLEDHTKACLHVVALPEELPVTEALQVAEAAGERLRMAPGIGFMNRLPDPLLEEGDAVVLDAVEAANGQGVTPYVEAARRRLEWQRWQTEHAAHFVRDVGMPVVVIPEIEGTRIDRRWLDRMVHEIDRAVGTVPGQVVDD